MARARKTNKKVLLMKPETTFNVDSSPSAATDAIYCADPTFMADITTLTRDNVRPNFSNEKNATGRKLAKIEFTIESRGNGKAQGLLANESQLGRVLKCCGMVPQYATTTQTLGPSIVDDHPNPVTFGAVTSTYAGTSVINLIMRVTTGGASGTAQVAVYSDDPTLVPDRAAAVITTGSAFTIATGVTVTPTFTGNLVIGQSWSVTLVPAGAAIYRPTSDEDLCTSATLYLNMDGIQHIITGAYGTAVLDGAVNGYGKWKCTFTGQYYDPTDVAIPANPVFERTQPVQIELAKLRVDGFGATCSKFTVDLGVTILPRLDANGSDGYNGTYIDDRNCTGGIDPEATLVADQNFWSKLAKGTAMPLTFRMGRVTGNTVSVRAGAAVYTNLTYQARDNLQTYDAGLMFAAVGAGDDEVIVIIN